MGCALGLPAHEPFRQALQEIKEGTGLAKSDVSLVSAGDPMEVDRRRAGIKWIVYPFLFRVKNPRKIRPPEPGGGRKWVTLDGFRRSRPLPWLVDALEKLASPPERKEPPEPVRKVVHGIATDRVHGASYLTEEALRAFEIWPGRLPPRAGMNFSQSSAEPSSSSRFAARGFRPLPMPYRGWQPSGRRS